MSAHVIKFRGLVESDETPSQYQWVYYRDAAPTVLGYHYVERAKRLQYIGTTEQGTDVYEDDIVVGHHGGNERVVEWDTKDCGYKPFIYNLGVDIESCKVVGSIHDLQHRQ